MNGHQHVGAGAPQTAEVVQGEEGGSLGSRLRLRRLRMGLSVAELAAQLRLRTSIIEAIETDDLDSLGADVFMRGYLSSYAKAVGLPMVAVEYASSRVTAPALVTQTRPRFGTLLGRYTSRLGHVFLTAAIVVPFIWLATSNQLPSQRATLTSLEVPEPADSSAAEMRSTTSTTSSALGALQGAHEPVMASLTPLFPQNPAPHLAAQKTPGIVTPSEPAPAAPLPGLSLDVSSDSWVQVLDADGQVLESALLRIGSSRSFPVEAGLRVKLGNAQGVQLRLNGEPIDVSAFQRENVAHFRLGPDGALGRANPG